MDGRTLYSNPQALAGVRDIGGGVREIGGAFKSWATTETGATVVGVAGGIFVGEWIGSWVTEYFDIEDGWTKVITKAVAKGALSFALFMVARRTGGILRLVLNGASAGSLASIIGDIVGEYVAPGLGIVPGGSSKNITIKAVNNPGLVKSIPAGISNIGNRAQVISKI